MRFEYDDVVQTCDGHGIGLPVDCVEMVVEIVNLLVAPEQSAKHSDDVAVDNFAAAMKEKLAMARDKGRGGWEQCTTDDLSQMLRSHVEKGDPRDVANFCMMLWHLSAPIAAAQESLVPTVDTLDATMYARAAAVMGTCPDGPTDYALKCAIVAYLGGKPYHDYAAPQDVFDSAEPRTTKEPA